MERVAVTGSTGYIGTHLVEALLKRGSIVYPIGRDYRTVECDVVYHLACPSGTSFIENNTLDVMDIILDGTRKALAICPTAKFINASSLGAETIDNTKQGAYNVAKRCMEIYISQSDTTSLNYRLPSVYGPGMQDDKFVKKCIDGRASYPTTPDALYKIAHIDDVVNALINFEDIKTEEITLGNIYEEFSSGRRGLYRSASN